MKKKSLTNPLNNFFETMICMKILTLNDLMLSPYYEEYGKRVQKFVSAIVGINASKMPDIIDKVLWHKDDLIQEVSLRLLMSYDKIVKKIMSSEPFYLRSYTLAIFQNYIKDCNRKHIIETKSNIISLDSKCYCYDDADESDTTWEEIIESDTPSPEDYQVFAEEKNSTRNYLNKTMLHIATSGRGVHRDRVIAFMHMLEKCEINSLHDIKKDFCAVPESDITGFISLYNSNLEMLSGVLLMDEIDTTALKAEKLDGFGRNFIPGDKTSKHISYCIGDIKSIVYKMYDIDPSESRIDHINITSNSAIAVLNK